MLKIDLHTHSVASGHALNTVFELAYCAAKNGITHLGITDHGPSMTGAPHSEYFWISDQLTELYGVHIYLGIEANILNQNGEIDLPEQLLKKQRIVSAGLHDLTPYKSDSVAYNTASILNAMQNPYVKIITHPLRPEFPVDLEAIFFESLKTNTLLELNNNLFSRKDSISELITAYKELVSLCKKYESKLIIGSDAHVATKIGNDEHITAFYDDLGLSDDIIYNNYPDLLEIFLKK